MSIFKRRMEEEMDLSDAALLSSPEAQDTAAGEADSSVLPPLTEEPADASALEQAAAATDEGVALLDEQQQAQRTLEEEAAVREAAWQQAACETVQHWPQIRQDMPAVLHKMVEISRRYGDETLWQRAPGGLMREAAVELFGMPRRSDPAALAEAVRQAHQQGRQQALQQQAKAGLAPHISQQQPAAPSAEEQIIRDMMRARSSAIF